MDALDAPWPAVVAVSGGSDSVALMLLLADWAEQRSLPPPTVLTVDHGLRTESAADARAVVRAAKAVGLKAHVLVWKGGKPSANVEAAAREARYRLMGGRCRAYGVNVLYAGHTRDDQAETFLLRLARGTGLDGLAAMAPLAPWPLSGFDGLTVARPLLGIERQALRDYLTARGVTWRDDPMNMEHRFARSRLRAVWPVLEQVGLTKTRIADTAAHLARVRQALESETARLLAASASVQNGGCRVDTAALAAVPREIGLRALAAVLRQVGGAAYRPRFERLENLFDALISSEFQKARTLHGCRIGPAPKASAIFGPATVVIEKELGRMKPDSGQRRT